VRPLVRHFTSALPRAASKRSGLLFAETLAQRITASPWWLRAMSTAMPGFRQLKHGYGGLAHRPDAQSVMRQFAG